MISCPECGREVPEQAGACPYCGKSLKRAGKGFRPWKMILALILVLAMVIGASVYFSDTLGRSIESAMTTVETE